MSIRQMSSSLTQYSNILKPIYQKVEQILKSKQLQLEKEKKKIIIQIIQPIPRVELKLNIDRKNQFIKIKQSKKENNLYNPIKTFNHDRRTRIISGVQAKTKTQRMLNFLRTNQSEKKLKNTQVPITQNQILELDRQSFTPIRSISRTSRQHQSVSGTSLTRKSSHNKPSTGGYSQIARLSNNSSNSNVASKYLRKGHRMRQTLLKQIQAPEDIEEEKELVYLKQYDQWVPASLASFKKLQLQHFLNILLGEKKNQKKQLTKFEPIYL